MSITQSFPSVSQRFSSAALGAALLTAAAMVVPAPACRGAEAAEEEKPKAPEELLLDARDGVQLAATFYPGGNGKESIPVVLLHGWKGSRKEYGTLALHLQKLKHAVLAVDLRGHGDSTHIKTDSRQQTLDAATMSIQQYGNMVRYDLPAAREFLREKNNAGELNLNKLCLVGAEMGAVVAMEFAKQDAYPGYFGRVQVGRFVKALVLISPDDSFKNLNAVRSALQDPYVSRELSVLIVVGKDKPKDLEAANKINDFFKKHHPEPPEEKRKEEKDLFFIKLETSLQGTKILDAEGINVEKFIGGFIDLRLNKCQKAKQFKWDERKKNPHAAG